MNFRPLCTESTIMEASKDYGCIEGCNLVTCEEGCPCRRCVSIEECRGCLLCVTQAYHSEFTDQYSTATEEGDTIGEVLRTTFSRLQNGVVRNFHCTRAVDNVTMRLERGIVVFVWFDRRHNKSLKWSVSRYF